MITGVGVIFSHVTASWYKQLLMLPGAVPDANNKKALSMRRHIDRDHNYKFMAVPPYLPYTIRSLILTITVSAGQDWCHSEMVDQKDV